MIGVPNGKRGKLMLATIGDSITEDTYQRTLRAELDKLLGTSVAQQSGVLFTGHRGSEPHRHSGTSGALARDMALSIAGWDIPYTPTDVVLNGGTNDLGAGAYTPAQTYAYVEQMRDAIATRWPSARRWLLLIPPNKAPSTRDTTTTNNLLDDMTNVYGIVDIRVGWVDATYQSADGVHPTTIGYQFIAQKIATAMQSVLP